MIRDSILQEIISNKHKEVLERKSLYPLKFLENSTYFSTNPVSLKKYILDKNKSPIIAEFKSRSPSKGIINSYAKVEQVSLGYMQAGAAALSILTDKWYFGGSLENLKKARQENYCPILQKDFIVDEYQIIEAKSYGADAILLIASILSLSQIKQFTQLANSLNMEVVLEIHDISELDKVISNISIVGINNRNLSNFHVNPYHSQELAIKVPDQNIKIAESGIDSPKTAKLLLENGFNGLLIGEAFMKHDQPGKACKTFIDQIKTEISSKL
ncbi:MAG: indole-3-glycerol phosphate synthase TrpC [Bacteroidales bacterium]